MSKCKICRAEYQKRSMTHKACSPECALELARRDRIKADRKDIRAKREALKTRSVWLKEAQVEFNKYIRLRDRELPCISCGRFHSGSYDAGHYRSVGAAPHLRFNEDNCHKQCVPCNQFKSGNIVEYRISLVNRIGLDRVEALEKSHGQMKFTIEDAKRIKAEYKEKVKALEAQS